MTEYRKKPVGVDAVQPEDPHGCFAALSERRPEPGRQDEPARPQVLKVSALGGGKRARPGGLAVRDISGAFCPGRPDIFAQTYEEVT